MTASLPIGFVASQLGISTSTLRKWESRYGYPVAHRDAQGVRSYDARQFEQLKLALRLIQNGAKPSQLFADDAANLVARFGQPAEVNVTTLDGSASYEPALNALYQLLLDSDLAGFERELTDHFDRINVVELSDQLLGPLMVRIGEGWMSGELKVFHEHAVSGVVEQLLATSVGQQPESAPLLLLATPSGERHHLPLAMLKSGMHDIARVIDLSVDLPVNELLEAAQHFAADIVCLSASTVLAPGAALEYLSQLRQQLPTSTQLWIGGQGFTRLKSLPDNVHFFSTIGQARAALPGVQHTKPA